MIAPTPLRWALAQLGQHEVGGPNCGPVVERSIAMWTDEPAGPEMLWCAAFVSTSLVAGGAERALSCGSLSAERLHERMRDYWIDEEPRAGDVLWFRREGNRWHVGLVSGTAGAFPHLQVQTVEGNASDAVSARTYAWREAKAAKVIGHARPRLAGYICGSLPPESSVRLMRPCPAAPGHSGDCYAPCPSTAIDQPRVVGPSAIQRRQGPALRALRTQLGLELQAAAQRFGLRASEWHGLEQGHLSLPEDEFARVCRGLQ